MSPKQNPETRNNILEAAKEVFVENGYEKTRMEDIAKKAQVTRMMLYYYFDSKDNIIKEIITQLLDTSKLKLEEGFKEMKSLKNLKPEMIVNKFREILIPNQAWIRFVILEFLKKNLDVGDLINLLKSFYDNLQEMIGRLGKKKRNRQETFTIRAFYYQTIPLMFYLFTSEDISRFLGVDPGYTEKVFTQKFIDTIIRTALGPEIK